MNKSCNTQIKCFKGGVEMELKWLGTAAVSISHEGKSIIFDPFRSLNLHLRYTTAEELAEMGDIFITHGHFDHTMDVPLITALGNSKVFCCSDTAKALIREGTVQKRIMVVQPGDIIENGPFTIKVLAGEHIHNDWAILFRTSVHALMHFQTLFSLLKLHRKFNMGKVLVYQTEAGGKTILHMGSLNLSASEVYPKRVDLMTLPYQGRSDLTSYSMQFIERVKPKIVFLHHYDNSFPPISSQIDYRPFLKSIHHNFPDIQVIIPEYRTSYPI
jgi:L-ascorbate metabolism protein UlaG (beta-lactamase superfamily)